MSRHLLLLSRGFGAVPDFVHTRVQRHPGAVRMGFVSAAVDTDDERAVADAQRATLAWIGYEMVDVDLDALSGDELARALRDLDAVFVAEGNPFVLLGRLRRSGFAEMLPGLLDAGLVYLGAGAGAVVVGPDIAPMTAMHDHERVQERASDEGLHLLGVVPIPHADAGADAMERLDRIRAQYGGSLHLEPIADDQAIIVEDDAAAVVESVPLGGTQSVR
ncbi:Type 1 glutamine amidotransferase-like domain-containing protein [Microbacterium sp. LRZ72]|uniref:Type 1 glutamine amidotransferase-like domain-containing protein n=1 Tax=Microbacterium sp. LRZ72 TaxID=2942481 RepID=UPI0029BED7B1|nr:Type 1 glutamine amidotransferase-like domain-containing protein [Microbacterium sp. LRZ72]MDX2376078.1 Type 1 glutamine amidotransferase-like domain-containing protein [Microbacterium sp. LRZ72]